MCVCVCVCVRARARVGLSLAEAIPVGMASQKQFVCSTPCRNNSFRLDGRAKWSTTVSTTLNDVEVKELW